VLDYLDDREIRELFYRATSRRAADPPFENRAITERVIELRRTKAHQLGYFHFADFVLEDRMAKRGERARDFLREIAQYTEFQFDHEQQELASFVAELGGPAKLEPWDISYYAEKLRKARFDLDEEELRPYFALDPVMEGMFEFAKRLFGVRVERVDAPGWDPGVECFQLLDEAAGAGQEALLGYFYTDWFPRENKRGGAWMDALRTGGPLAEGGFRPHIGLICGNLTPPIGEKPALLTHLEVETIFHEFGHLLHHCLSRVPVRSLAGTNVAWDFVELPSQILENWCWEREALALFARHHETGEPIPAALHAKMTRARNFRVAHAQMRQLGFGVADLKLHMEYEARHWREETGGDVVDYARAVLQYYSPAELPPDHATILSFSHLFSSPVAYAAGYYSYKWAEVLSADVFSRFLSEGVFSPEAGMAYRRSILESGDSADPGELFRALMGRDPDSRALLRRQGLLVA
jgi:oligopeptidase A